jgi:hypothetical protein
MERKILTEVLAQRASFPLYHYTTQNGLLGIIKKREIWASHTQYLNDTREYVHALEIVREEIQALIADCTNTEGRELLEEMDQDIRGVDGKGVRAADGNVCVCSFSEDRDSLSLWRAYLPAAAGFAIGIPGEHLEKLVAKQEFYLARCIYNRADQQELIRALIAEVLDENRARRAETGTDDRRLPRGGNLHFYLHRYAPILKDPAFHHEREWRIISGPLMCTFQRFDFRNGQSMLIPYYNFALELKDGGLPLQVHEIVVGPTPNPEKSARSVKGFLVSQELDDTLVHNSTVPYRHW